MDNIEDYRKAGKIAAEALAYGKSLIVKGASILEVSDKVEKRIHELGGELAFPVQVSSDAIAAHYCAEKDDKIIFDKQVVSLDVGVHVNGAIGDNAISVDLSGEHGDLIKASEEALASAIKVIRDGVTLAEIGRAIQEAIESYGFVPVRNLSGHGLDLYNIHSEPTIPNFDTDEDYQLHEGMVIAIEPFATNGMGLIHESGEPSVFAISERKPVRSQFTRDVLKEIQTYNGLPFCRRWLISKFPAIKVNYALHEMNQLGMIHPYPPLVERGKGLVSQAEHTVLITKDGCEVLTKI